MDSPIPDNVAKGPGISSKRRNAARLYSEGRFLRVGQKRVLESPFMVRRHTFG
ncbi:MAG: hypothetical protein OXU68_15540 [Bacteroidota bacterium]|nr:hypothetical protein [Bacteroidota bacterium]MDE2958397.1 hypothetical protein [Bacteroidota bacterium]